MIRRITIISRRIGSGRQKMQVANLFSDSDSFDAVQYRSESDIWNNLFDIIGGDILLLLHCIED
jgi:hypothetical protein